MNQGNSAPPQRVEEMFDRISGVYDGMNLAISGFQEPRWRRALVRASGIGPGGRALDVACGTGKVTADLYRAAQPGGRALGIDFSAGMIGIAAERFADDAQGLSFQQGDALDLPVDDDAFDAATIAFGMRNLADYRLGFAEMARAVRPGGRVACLEITRPSSRLGRLVAGWFDHIVPLIGRLIGQGDAYAYLVQSTKDYPDPSRIAQIMREAGLVDIDWRPMSGGHRGAARRHRAGGRRGRCPLAGGGAARRLWGDLRHELGQLGREAVGQLFRGAIGLACEEVLQLAGVTRVALGPCVAEAAADVVQLAEAVPVLDVVPAAIRMVRRRADGPPDGPVAA